jgi:hypothetical protein
MANPWHETGDLRSAKIRPGKLQDICNMGGTGFNNLDEGWCQMVSDGLASYLRKTT